MANISSKAIRMQVYNKYDGHCAYCGKKLEYKDMQVDHMIPQKRKGSDDISNLQPVDRTCNLYKRAFGLETFRRFIFEIPQKLMKVFIFKVGLQYGLVELHEKPIKFYFEQYNEMKNKENIENNLDKVSGGISEQPITESHKTCPLCGMEVWFTKDMTMESHQQSNICKMSRK